MDAASMHDHGPKPIETVYAGCRFRSRLEARWAVFFDRLGIEWEYEPQGFEGDYGRYLPDFRLRRALWTAPLGNPWAGLEETRDVYVEVKGTDGQVTQADRLRMGWLIDWMGPLSPGLLLLGPIPRPGRRYSHDLCFWHKGVALGAVEFKECGYPTRAALAVAECEMYRDQWAVEIFDGDSECLPSSATWDAHPLQSRAKVDQSVDDAYTAARSARFEHGQRG